MSIRTALRTLLRSPWHAAATVGTIGLTVALSATVFAVVDGVLFRPLPYPDADRLFVVAGLDAKGRNVNVLSWTDVRHLAEADPRIAVTAVASALLPSPIHPDRPDVTVPAYSVAPNFFDVMGVRPLFGGFLPEHFSATPPAGVPRPAIIAFERWREWLGGDSNPLGRVVELAGVRLLVVGVLPRDFLFPMDAAEIGVLTPLVVSPSDGEDRWRRVIARFRHDIELADAERRLDAALASRVGEYPPTERTPGRAHVGTDIRALASTLGQVRRPLLRVTFGGAVLLVLLGAINVTVLTVARSGDRAREFALRIALGARRVDLVRLWLTETTLVALMGAAIGLAFAQPLLSATLSILPAIVPLLKAPRIDWRVVTFAFIAAVLPLVLAAIVPAVTAARQAVANVLAGGGRSSLRVRSWSRGALLAVESALGITIIVAGSLVLAGFLFLRSEDVGFDPDRLAVVELATVRTQAIEERQARAALAFDRIRQVPGVRDVAIIGVPFLELQLYTSRFRTPAQGTEIRSVHEVPVSGAFFDIAGLRLIEGRFPTREEIDSGQPVAALNDRVARAYWPERPALGQTLEGGGLTVTVVGVVELAQLGSQWHENFGQIYIPVRLIKTPPRAVFLVQTDGDPQAVARAVGAALKRDVPGALVRRAESLDSALLKSVEYSRFSATLLGIAGGAALLLVTIGIAGLVATNVARRVREMGIRTALGARPVQLVRLVVMTQLRPALAGIALGLIASWWTTRLVKSYVYRYDAHDLRVWAVATAVLIGAAALAAWIPARRASRVDPTVALRAE